MSISVLAAAVRLGTRGGKFGNHPAPRLAGNLTARVYTDVLYSLSVMSTPTPEIHVGSNNPDAPLLPLATDGVLRYVWHGKFGDMLVEVLGDGVFVNSHKVEPLLPVGPAVAPASSVCGRSGPRV